MHGSTFSVRPGNGGRRMRVHFARARREIHVLHSNVCGVGPVPRLSAPIGQGNPAPGHSCPLAHDRRTKLGCRARGTLRVVSKGGPCGSVDAADVVVHVLSCACRYNDPAFAASVTAPTFAATGFYAFCAVSFIVLLLLYWLVHFDAARRLGENHIAGAAGGASEIIIRR